MATTSYDKVDRQVAISRIVRAFFFTLAAVGAGWLALQAMGVVNHLAAVAGR